MRSYDRYSKIQIWFDGSADCRVVLVYVAIELRTQLRGHTHHLYSLGTAPTVASPTQDPAAFQIRR